MVFICEAILAFFVSFVSRQSNISKHSVFQVALNEGKLHLVDCMGLLHQILAIGRVDTVYVALRLTTGNVSSSKLSFPNV